MNQEDEAAYPTYVSDSFMFKALNPEEMEEFKQHAQENDPPSDDWSLYHPVCRAEWAKRGLRPGLRKEG